MTLPEKLYRYHVENLRAIEVALDDVEATLRRAVARGANRDRDSFVRLNSLLLGVWAECRLSKLLFEKDVFSSTKRNGILAKSTLLDKWLLVVETGFRKHYAAPKAQLTETTLPHSAFAQYTTLLDLLRSDLRMSIETRNKLAHGQWAYPLKSEGSEVSERHMVALKNENAFALKAKRRILRHLAEAVHDLSVSLSTLDRDFDSHYLRVIEARQQLRNRSYEGYATQLRSRFIRGQERARANRAIQTDAASPPR